MSRLLLRLTLLLVIGGSLTTPTLAQGADRVVADLQAAFIYQFTSYIDWPGVDFRPEENFGFWIVGNNSIAQSLERLAAQKKNKEPIARRPINLEPRARR